MTTLFHIQIPKRSKVCFSAQEVLSPGMDYYSLLIENNTHEYVRQDFCAVCWSKFLDLPDGKKKTLGKHWKSKVPVKKEAPQVPQNRDEQILSLLRNSLSGDMPEDREMSFVLALYLARKRFMILRKEMRQEDKTVIQLYEIPETEEMILIPKIELSSLQIEDIQLKIAKKLQT